MKEQKLVAIESWLAGSFMDCPFERRNDFDRGATTYKIHAEHGTLMLKIGDEFVGDHSSEEILQLLALWGVSDALASHTELGVLVTERGPATFVRGT